MPGFGKAGISFLICIRLIVQGLAKNTVAKRRALKKFLFCDFYAYVIRTPIREHL